MSQLYYLASGSKYSYSSIRFHISPEPCPPHHFCCCLIIKTNSKQIEHTEQVSALDSGSNQEGYILPLPPHMEIKPVSLQLSNPLQRGWVSAFFTFWLLGIFLGGGGVVFYCQLAMY